MQVIAISNIKHNGTLYKKGDVVENLSEVQLKKLQELNVVQMKTEETISPVTLEQENEVKDATASSDENENEVAAIVPTMKMGKEKIMGIGVTRGVELNKTMTKAEMIDLIVADMDKNSESEE